MQKNKKSIAKIILAIMVIFALAVPVSVIALATDDTAVLLSEDADLTAPAAEGEGPLVEGEMPAVDAESTETTGEEEEETKTRAFWLELVLLVAGAGVIAFGADLLVENGTAIAHALNVPETVIALTFVALGTSLPELITTITSLRKGHASLGIGNVIGANVFNLVLVSGVAVSLAPFEVPVGKLLFGQNASLVLDIPLMITVMLLLTVPALLKKKLGRWQGITMLIIYAAFCLFQFVV